MYLARVATRVKFKNNNSAAFDNLNRTAIAFKKESTPYTQFPTAVGKPITASTKTYLKSYALITIILED